mgnify:CR=1 FL=1
MKAIIGPWLHLLWRIQVEGRKNVPRQGPVILAANHQSFCDSFFLPLVVRRRRVTYVAKAEYFDSWKTAWFFRAAGQIPMNRSGGDASQRALDTARGVLEGGDILAIYPEGTRAPDQGKLYRLHSRILVPLLEANPTVPVHAVATRYEKLPLGRIKVTAKISPKLAIDSAVMTADEMVTTVRDALVQLGDLVYVNQYAFVAKARLQRQKDQQLGS